MDCKHIITQGKNGEIGSWCTACGVKVYDVDTRECKDCKHSKHLINGWICSHHLMGISPDMHVTFKIEKGTCWQAPTDTE